MISAMEGYYEN